MFETASLNDPRFRLFQKRRELGTDDYIKFLEDRVVFLESELEKSRKSDDLREQFERDCG